MLATDGQEQFTGLDSPLETVSQMPPGDFGAAFVKMFLTLIALIALLLVTYWFMRKIIQHRLQKGSRDATIQILEKRMISPKTMIYLLEIENKKIVIAESHLEIKKLEAFNSDPVEEFHAHE